MVVGRAVDAIRRVRDRVPGRRSALVAVSGIDASGKGYSRPESPKRWRRPAYGPRCWGWTAGSTCRPSGSIRRIPPSGRACRVVAEFTGETATAYRPHLYEFGATDVILLEGIFLLKPAPR